MTLLSIAQRTAELVGIPDISSVIGNSDGNVRQIKASLQTSGDTLCQMTDSEGDSWSVLERIYEFLTTRNETGEFNLPEDFLRQTTDTAWQKDKYWRMRGSLSGRQWQKIRNRRAQISYNIFRIKRAETLGLPGPTFYAPNYARKFIIEPPPEEAITIVYEYISRYWWIASDGATFKAEPTADDDQSVFGDQIHILDCVWRFKQLNGIAFTTDLTIFEDFRDKAFAQDTPKEPIQIGHTRRPIGAYPDESDIEWCG